MAVQPFAPTGVGMGADCFHGEQVQPQRFLQAAASKKRVEQAQRTNGRTGLGAGTFAEAGGEDHSFIHIFAAEAAA